MKRAIIKAGSLVVLTYGEYSSYTLMTVCRALDSFDIEFLRAEYLDLFPNQDGDSNFSEYGFTKWLTVDKKVLEELDYMEWYLGGYSDGDFDLRPPLDKDE